MWQPNIGQGVNRICRECNISEQKAYPCNFRDTHSGIMLKNTGNLHLVSKLLGHCTSI